MAQVWVVAVIGARKHVLFFSGRFLLHADVGGGVGAVAHWRAVAYGGGREVFGRFVALVVEEAFAFSLALDELTPLELATLLFSALALSLLLLLWKM